MDERSGTTEDDDPDEDWTYEVNEFEDEEQSGDWEYGLEELGGEEQSDVVEAGTPTLEGIAFVVLGAAAAVLALLRMLPGM